jgi:hypothetical protein
MMKAGTETGSLINHIYSQGNGPTPEVGMGCTILRWTDRSAGTVVWVSKTGKTIKVQDDKAIRADTNGMSEAQEYTYERDETAPIRVFRLTKKGWRGQGGGPGLSLGFRRAYHDYSF